MTLLVRDEEDVLEANLDYHLSAGVDFFIVTDHRSNDGTPAILERYRRRGYLHVLSETGEAYEQGRWVTGMARLACLMGATWVINSDADEFWWPLEGTLATTLMKVPARYDVVTAQTHDFAPPESEGGLFWQRMVYRDVKSYDVLGRPQPPKVCHRARGDIIVSQGNHAVSAPGLGQTLDDGTLEILHFPVRNYAQLERKIAAGGAGYEAPGAPTGVGGTWRHAYALLRAGRLSELYDQRVLDQDMLERRLGAGSVIHDLRLAERLAQLSST
jgi:hypothetical protein